MATDREQEYRSLMLIAGGLIVILLVIVVGIYLTPRALPNWAENVLVSIGTAGALKLGDCLSTLVALAGGRQTARATELVAQAAPVGEPSKVEVVNDPLEVKNADKNPK